MTDRPRRASKRDVVGVLLTRGSVFVHLDPRVEGTQVPGHLAGQSQIVLQIGLDLPVPIVDLSVDGDGIRGTLSFQRSPFRCFVPWAAVFGVVAEDGEGTVWPEDLPAEIAAEVEREAMRQRRERRDEDEDRPARGKRGSPALARSATRRDPVAPARPPKLRSLPGGAGSEGKPGTTKRALPSYLRVIK